MRLRNYLPLAIWSGLMIIGFSGLNAQFGPPSATEDTFVKKNVLREQAVIVKDQQADILLEFGADPAFPNINREPYYFDKKEFESLAKLEKMEEGEDPDLDDLEQLDRSLTEYVHQFGILNFSRNVDLLWKAGRIKELLGDTTRAVYYYELAQIHNYGTQAPVLAYDTLTSATRSEWLPIDEYYRLLEVRRRIDDLLPPTAVLTPMGQEINTNEPEYAPFMHPTDSIMIFTSRRDTTGMTKDAYVDPYAQFNEDLYLTEIDFITGDWMDAYRLSDTINSEFNEGSACLAPDGRTLYFTRCREGRGFGSCDIYRATYDPATGAWGHVQNLGKNVNSKSWDSQPNISSDGRTLFFVSNRKDGFGGTDLYYSTMQEDGRFGPAQNVGPMVNTPKNEVTPFFHKINSTLFFSSTGQMENFGGYDIFKARWLGTDWAHPSNVGPLINTDGNEYYFTISGKGTKIFYSNAKDLEKDHVEQNFDLYSYPMPMEARPDAIASLKGFLVDSVTGYPLQGTVMIIDMQEGIEVTPKQINENGYFEFDLINDRRYRLFVMSDSIFTIVKDVELTKDTLFQVFTQSFEKNKPIVFEALQFKSNSARIGGTFKPRLDYIVEFLKTYPMFKLVVEGHTDSDGRAESNMRLSSQRAKSLADYIIRKGDFNKDRVSAEGYGATKPVVPNDSDENKRKNRRVEFRLIFDELYEGDMWLPTEAELKLEDKKAGEEDPEFDDEFEWTPEELEQLRKEQEAFEAELRESDNLIDLEAELETDIANRANQQQRKDQRDKKKKKKRK
ncbi:MAG: OmpA family protein [Bacteroidota bacterium]